MKDLINQLRDLSEACITEESDYFDLAQKYGFGTPEWQDAMIDLIKKKLENNEELTGTDIMFIEVQIDHNARLKDELQAMGFPGGRLSVN